MWESGRTRRVEPTALDDGLRACLGPGWERSTDICFMYSMPGPSTSYQGVQDFWVVFTHHRERLEESIAEVIEIIGCKRESVVM